MLPMFTHPDEVRLCLNFIRGRVPLTLLVETAAALARLHTILNIPGFDDVHIGLNDLHLDMGLDFMFELLSSNLLDGAARIESELNIPLHWWYRLSWHRLIASRIDSCCTFAFGFWSNFIEVV